MTMVPCRLLRSCRPSISPCILICTIIHHSHSHNHNSNLRVCHHPNLFHSLALLFLQIRNLLDYLLHRVCLLLKSLFLNLVALLLLQLKMMISSLLANN